MKRLLLAIAIVFLVASVSGNLVLDMQQPADFIEHLTCEAGICHWVQNTSGGNNCAVAESGHLRNTDPMRKLRGRWTQGRFL